MVAGSQLLFLSLVIGLAIQRLAEQWLSSKNVKELRKQGGYEVGRGHLRLMQVLHGSWFLAMLLEVFLLRRNFRPQLALVASALFLCGQALRYAAITALGPRWTVPVMILPGAPAVNKGVYRYLRHPNYLGVILELIAVPLIHSAFLTSLIFSILNAFLLTVRIRTEEKALTEQNDYEVLFQGQKRLIPKIY